MVKFKSLKNKNIVYCILDITDNCQSGYAREICVNLSDFLIHRIDLHGYDIMIGQEQDQLLVAASEEGYEYAVIISAGTSLGLSDRLFESVEKQCRTDFFIAGHIIDRSDNAYYKENAGIELHQQFYIVNLLEYKQLGCPIVGDEIWQENQQLAHERSREFLYNDIRLPAWIKQGTTTKIAQVKLHGWNIINQGLANNKKIIQLSQEIRSNKRYLYYEYDHVFLTRLSEINYYQFFAMNFFAGWNSDPLKDSLIVDGPIEQYITVGIGFNWIKNLELTGFTEKTKVIFTDINHNCLMFMKKMVEEWDGNNYADFYWTHKPMMPNNSPYIPENYKQQIQDHWNKFLSTIEDWPNLWKQITQLTYKYILIDYTASFNFDWLKEEQKTILNLSNLYNHSPYVAHLSLKYRISCENQLIQKLKQKDPNVILMLSSRAADGFWKEDCVLIDRVCNFNYTDIEKLNRPNWHNHDWSNPSDRPLGITQ